MRTLEPSGVRSEGDAEVSGGDLRALVDEATAAAAAAAVADSGHASDDEDEELFPVGDSNYAACIDDNQWLVDRTKFIRRLMTSKKALLFTRPRRFGKSMTLNMLAAFLDVNNAGERFDQLFGHTWIGRPENEAFRAKHASKYHVLKLDFSGIPHASPDGFFEGFAEVLERAVDKFLVSYPAISIPPPRSPVSAISAIAVRIRARKGEVRGPRA